MSDRETETPEGQEDAEGQAIRKGLGETEEDAEGQAKRPHLEENAEGQVKRPH